MFQINDDDEFISKMRETPYDDYRFEDNENSPIKVSDFLLVSV